eukprot:7391955-Prymnesium_polylepis.1
MRLGHEEMFLKMAPVLKDAREKLARAQQDYEAEQTLTQKLATEVAQLKGQLNTMGVQDVDENEVLPGISLDDVLQQLTDDAAADSVTNLVSPISQAEDSPSVATESDCTLADVSRQQEPMLSLDELDELLMMPEPESFENDSFNLGSPPGLPTEPMSAAD